MFSFIQFVNFSNIEIFLFNFSQKIFSFSFLLSSSFSEQVNPIIKNLLIIDSYDFTKDANVKILGQIFEQSISDIEKLYKGESIVRKKFGVYYTPDYVTDYICRNSILPFLSKNNSKTVENLVKEYEESYHYLWCWKLNAFNS